MSLEDCLEIYNTDKKEDNKLLNKLCKNVSTEYCESVNNKDLINKITKAFDNIEMILWRFENENRSILDEIKKYILGYRLDDENAFRINDIMQKWGMYFDSIGVLPNIRNSFIDKYRHDYLVEYFKQEKSEVLQTEYLQYLIFVKKMWESDKNKQIEILEEYYRYNSIMSDWMIDYLANSNNQNRLNKDATIVIGENYIESLKDERFLLKTIKDIYDEIFRANSYENYIANLEMIYLFQKRLDKWVDISKLDGLLDDCSLSLLKRFHLVDEVNLDDKRIIRLTELGISIANRSIVENWLSDKYFIELESTVLIPCNSNPLIISKYFFDKNYILKETDFLIILERKVIDQTI